MMAIHRNDLGIAPRRPVSLAAGDDGDPAVVIVGQAPALPGAVAWAAVEWLPASVLRRDGDTQLRAGVNPKTLENYKQLIAESDRDDSGRVVWPFRDPVECVKDMSSGDHWLIDGFQRLAAWGLFFGDSSLASVPPVPVHVRPVDGDGRRAAVLAAAGANVYHGAARTDADKRSAVDRLLADPEWAAWSDHELARRAGVSAPFVASRKKIMAAKAAGGQVAGSLGGVPPTVRKYTDRNGNERSMDTSGIGRKSSGAALGRAIRAASWGDQGRADQAAGILAAGKLGGGGSVVQSSAAASRADNPAIGKCRVCNRPLSDPASAAAGVGPCCAGKASAAAAGAGSVEHGAGQVEHGAGQVEHGAGVAAADDLAAVHAHLAALIDALPLLRRELSDPASAAIWAKLQAAAVPAIERVGSALVAGDRG